MIEQIVFWVSYGISLASTYYIGKTRGTRVTIADSIAQEMLLRNEVANLRRRVAELQSLHAHDIGGQ